MCEYEYDTTKREEDILEATFLILASGILPWTFSPEL